MPLKAGVSRATFESNVRDMINAGHPQKQALAAAYRKRDESGVANRASGGAVPWFVKREAAGMVHSGPVMSAVPGRTDRHNINVLSGSYVMPSETVSHAGENNTLAGFKQMNALFGNSGPYGMGHNLPIHHGSLPRPPRIPKFSSGGLADEGGARGEEEGQIVPVVVAGGEWIIHPSVVKNVGRAARVGSLKKSRTVPYHKNDLKIGHAVLDKYVMDRRKEHVDTLKNLAPPAKK